MFFIRIAFKKVETVTTLTYDSQEACEKMYERFQQLKSDGDVFYGHRNTIDFKQVRMISML
jgi:hypothetical protein